ncbi:MAG: stage II sporulation protein D [Clostridia bacterium]|nr:stage II sporulation protein D [Clostridia bacterium]
MLSNGFGRTSAYMRRRAKRRAYPRGAAMLAALTLGFLLGLGFSPRGAAKNYDLPPLSLTPESSPAPSEDRAEALEASLDEGPAVKLPSSVITVSIGGEPVTMELEEYIVGVVAAEMDASSEPAALEAQAIAARTFTALHMEGRASCKSGCTVCSDPHCCQAYMTEAELSAFWGARFETNIQKIRSAVEATRGVVATYGGKLISALYHASSGPATESSAEVFAVAQPYLVSVESFEGDSEMVSVQEFPLEETIDKLNAAFPQAGLSLPLSEGDFDIWGRTKSGRVQLIRIGGAVVTGGQMRMALGLRSTAFDVTHDGSTISFTCTGYGHGVGMSQTGANEMAKDGATCREIITHFYTGTELAVLVYGG